MVGAEQVGASETFHLSELDIKTAGMPHFPIPDPLMKKKKKHCWTEEAQPPAHRAEGGRHVPAELEGALFLRHVREQTGPFAGS